VTCGVISIALALVAAAAIRAAAIHAATNEHQGRAHHRLISLMKVLKGRLIM